jgi:hypothetical protein
MRLGLGSWVFIFVAACIHYGKTIPTSFYSSQPMIHLWNLDYDWNWKKILMDHSPCISFSVSHKTTCNDMCLFCRRYLGQDQFYFTDNVCLRKDNGIMCHGTPIPSTNYTCCVY